MDTKERGEKQFLEHRVDDRFPLLNSFEIKVPDDYNHDTQLATFAKYAKKEKFYYYNSDIIDKHYEKATRRLVTGKTYSVKIFAIRQRVSSDNCLAFLASHKAILVGAQGISLACQLKKEEFPVEKCTVSFDEKKALWKDVDGYHRVPYVDRYSCGDWGFNLGGVEYDWNDGYCLVCFCHLPTDQAGE